jgi:hypothetical protein
MPFPLWLKCLSFLAAKEKNKRSVQRRTSKGGIKTGVPVVSFCEQLQTQLPSWENRKLRVLSWQVENLLLKSFFVIPTYCGLKFFSKRTEYT